MTHWSHTTDGYSGRRTAQIVGISYRQLDYWARTGLVEPSIAGAPGASGSGFVRRYSPEDLTVLAFVRSLLDGGMKLEAVRTVMEALDYAEIGRSAGGYVGIPAAHPPRVLAEPGDIFDDLDDGDVRVLLVRIPKVVLPVEAET